MLAAVHLDPTRNWTVEALASVMGASRSSFAAIVGQTPARYVAEVKMHQARQWIVAERLRIGVVARCLGYGSEASFSRAFKRVTGLAPSQMKAMAPKALRTPAYGDGANEADIEARWAAAPIGE